MHKINLRVEHLLTEYNGKPKDVNNKYLDWDNYWLIKVSLKSPGYNNDEEVEGAITFSDMDKEVDFTSLPPGETCLFTCDVGNDVDVKAQVFYVENEDWLRGLLRQSASKLFDKVRGYIEKLELDKIYKIPTEILPILKETIKEGVERKTFLYEIGNGELKKLEDVNVIDLAGDGVFRNLIYFAEAGSMDKHRDENVEIVPPGPNGNLRIRVEQI